MNKPTIVTSLYDIDRQNLDGRNWNQYLIWFSKTLRLNSPMVIFVDDDNLVNMIEQIRKDLPTKIVKLPLESSYYYQYKEKIEDIINSENYKSKITGNKRIECRSSLYNIVQYSKFFWVEKAIELNYFSTERFLWLDAGISRFFESIDLDNSFTSKNISDEDLKDKLFLQTFIGVYTDLCSSDYISEDYFWDERSYVAGGIFLVDKNSMKNIKSIIDDVLLKKMLNNSVMNNEQICLGYLLKKHPDQFLLFKHYQSKHRNYEILNYLQ
jgi:hypothetical protein